MSFQVRLSERAIRDLRGLPRPVQVRVLTKLEQAAENPTRHFRRLIGAKAYRMRVGDYRVVADVVVSQRRIDVLHAGHRGSVYE